MNFVQKAISYLLTAGNWTGPVGLATRIAEHLQYTAIAVGASALIAVPIGMIIGHTGRGTLLVVGRSTGCARCRHWACCCSGCCSSGWVWVRRWLP